MSEHQSAPSPAAQCALTRAAPSPLHGSGVISIDGNVAWTARPHNSQVTRSPGWASGTGRQEPGQTGKALAIT